MSSSLNKVKKKVKKSGQKSAIKTGIFSGNYVNRFRQAAMSNDHWQVMQLGRILSKSELNEQDEKGRSALHFACANGNHQIVQSLIKYGADVNIRDINGNSPLHLAVISNRLKLVNALLEAGAKVDTKDANQRSPLDMAQSRLNFLKKDTPESQDDHRETVMLGLIKLLKHYTDRFIKSANSTKLNVIPENMEQSLDRLTENLNRKCDMASEAHKDTIDKLQSILDNLRLT